MLLVFSVSDLWPCLFPVVFLLWFCIQCVGVRVAVAFNHSEFPRHAFILLTLLWKRDTAYFNKLIIVAKKYIRILYKASVYVLLSKLLDCLQILPFKWDYWKTWIAHSHCIYLSPIWCLHSLLCPVKTKNSVLDAPVIWVWLDHLSTFDFCRSERHALCTANPGKSISRNICPVAPVWCRLFCYYRTSFSFLIDSCQKNIFWWRNLISSVNRLLQKHIW